MVFYCFDRRKKPQDPVDLKGKLRKILGDIVFSFGILILQFFLIYYTQYQLFHRKIDNETCYFTTLTFFFISGVITLGFNGRIFIRNNEKFTPVMVGTTGGFIIMNTVFTHFTPTGAIFPAGCIGRVLTHLISTSFLCIQIPNFLKNLAVFENAIKCYRARNDENGQEYYYRMIDAKADAGFCGMLDCFLRGSPLQILHIALFLQGNVDIIEISVLDQIPIWAPLVLLPWAATAYQESLRKQQGKSFPFWLYLTWNILLLTSRNFCIGAIMSLYLIPTSCVILVHWFLSTIWLCYVLKPLEFYNYSKFWHALYCSIFGFIYIWEPINLNKKRTSFRFNIWFYVTIFLQNSLALFFWVLNAEFEIWPFRLIVATGFEIVFMAGIARKACYYSKMHSKNSIQFPGDTTSPVETS